MIRFIFALLFALTLCTAQAQTTVAWLTNATGLASLPPTSSRQAVSVGNESSGWSQWNWNASSTASTNSTTVAYTGLATGRWIQSPITGTASGLLTTGNATVALGIANKQMVDAVGTIVTNNAAAGLAATNGVASGLTTATVPTVGNSVVNKTALDTAVAGASRQQTNYVFDDFDRADSTLNGLVTPTGQTWSTTGAGYLTAGVTNRQYTATGNTYAYLDYGSAIPRIGGTFMYSAGTGTDIRSTAVVVLIADAASGGLSTMLHLFVSPTSWTLQKRLSGGAFIDILSGTHDLLSNVPYNIAYEISGNTVTVYLPQGSPTSITDTDIGSINARYGCWQVRPDANGLIGKWMRVSMGPEQQGRLAAVNQAAAAPDIGWLRGDGGTRVQRVTSTLNGTGWYRIATSANYLTVLNMGHVKLTSVDPYRNQLWEFDASTIFNGTPILRQTYGFAYAGGTIGQVRLSTDSGSLTTALDVYVGNAQTNTLTAEFVGFFTPVSIPVVGATVLPTASTTLTFASTGNGTAGSLSTGRTIAITGDIAYTSQSFDGSANVTAAGTLATVNSNVGTFGSATQAGQVVVNGKGLVTAATNVTITPAASSLTGLGTGVATSLAASQGIRAPAFGSSDTLGTFMYDDFATSDTPINGRTTPTGQAWSVTGTGYLSAGITNRQFSSGTNVYAYLDYGAAISRISGTFSFSAGSGTDDRSINTLMLVADQSSGGLSTMLHLIVSPTTWSLSKYVADVQTGITSGTHDLVSGVPYNVAYEISGTNLTIYPPQGIPVSVSDASIPTIAARHGAWQINPNANGLIGKWWAVSMGPNQQGRTASESRAAPSSEIGWLRGNDGTRVQRITATLSGGAGWYRIATAATYLTFDVLGHIKVSALDQYRANVWEFDASAIYNGTPILRQTYGYGPSAVISQARLSTLSGSYQIGLDVYVANADPVTLSVDLVGFFTPVSKPTVGAVALATASTTLAYSATGDGTAGSLSTARTLGITGDLTWTSPSFDGSANVTAAGTLATVNANVGTFGSATQVAQPTFNGKGLATAVANVTITPAVGSITGLGTGVGTFLGTPSSANLRSAITDETGTGVAVFNQSPTILSPTFDNTTTTSANPYSSLVNTSAASTNGTWYTTVASTGEYQLRLSNGLGTDIPAFTISRSGASITGSFLYGGYLSLLGDFYVNGANTSIRAPASASAGTYFPVFTANPAGAFAGIKTRTAAELRSDIGAGTGSGTVTSVSVTTANGVSGTVATGTTTPAISLTLGAITPTSVAATGAVSGTTLTSTVATGTAPLTVASTTLVSNLNADKLDGLHKGGIQPANANLTNVAALTVQSLPSTIISVTENTQTGTTYTVLSTDNGKVVTLNNGSAITVTVPTLSAGFSCTFIQKGAGQVTFTTSGTTVSNAHSQTKTFGQYAAVTLYGLSSTTFVLAGDTGT